MNSPSSSSESSDRALTSYVINNVPDTRELVARILEDKTIFHQLSIAWKHWFATHPEHLGKELTKTLAYESKLPDVIFFMERNQ